jgi:molybdopterin/thiamine biosynthesis adenylyltransferase
MLRQLRHALMPEIGREGVARIAGARVLVVGAGGLGSAALPYLVGAGVGRISIFDGDRIERSNLHRQVLYRDADVGRPKAEAAAATLAALNPEVEVVAFVERLEGEALRGAVAGHDLVLDGSDNYPTKYALSDAAFATGTPLVYASVTAMDALATLMVPGETPCLRCLFPQPPATPLSCATLGVLGPLVGVTGALQALEALKFLVGDGALETLAGRLWTLDARDMTTRVLQLTVRPGCAHRD